MNYPGPGATVANAAIVPAGTSGSIDIFSGNEAADVIIDINGYYTPFGVVNGITPGPALARNSVTAGAIAPGSVGNLQLAPNAVIPPVIANGAVVRSLNGLTPASLTRQ